MQPGGGILEVDAVRRFKVPRDSCAAQDGKSPGGQVTIVTQPGPIDSLRAHQLPQFSTAKYG